MVSSGSRVCRVGSSDPVSFHGAVLGTRRPLGYSGVSETQSRPLLVPVDVHRLGDQRLGRDQREIELRMHFDLRRGVRRRGRSALDVAQRVAPLLGLDSSSTLARLPAHAIPRSRSAR